mgnify:CR=1 FL=1
MENRLKEIHPNIEEILLNAYKIKDVVKTILYAMDFCNNEEKNTDNFISIVEVLLSMTEEQIKQIDDYKM